MSTEAKPAVSSTERKHAAWVNLLSGGFGSAFAKSILSPVQRVVVMKQLGDHRHLSSVQIARMIAEKEGIAQGFWRGNGLQVMLRFPYGGLQFLVFGKTKFYLEDALGIGSNSPDAAQGFSPSVQKFITKCGAGGFSAAIAGTIVYPGEVIRLRLMSGDERYRKIFPTVRSIWHEANGPRNFYRGLWASLVQRVPDILINFAVYETVKKWCDDANMPNVAGVMLGGSSAALGSVAVCYPLDVVKRRIGMAGQLKNQVQYRGVAHCLSVVVREQGVAGLYSGALLEAMRCMPQVVIMWFAIEESRKFLSRFE